MRRVLAITTLCVGLLGSTATAVAGECIAPAKPKAGFDLTCELLTAGLRLRDADAPLLVTSYMPGGIGAVTYNAIITRRNAEPDTLIAFSGGSLFSIAQGRFGRFGTADVRWLAGIGIDHGVLIVRKDSLLRNLKDLTAALRRSPDKVVMGGSGTVGSQDWMKAALVAKAAGVGRNAFRFVGFEGGGEANAALQKAYVDVVSGDYSEAIGLIRNGAEIRILSVLSSERLPHQDPSVPTAGEEGFNIVWPNIRGLYMGPKVRNADYDRWVEVLDSMLQNPAFAKLRDDRGLLPMAKTGNAFEAHVRALVAAYQQLLQGDPLLQPQR
ncbi:MAG: tripartite tricarboxylate transporter substrate-binding protein [Rubrivivax sp.]